MLSSIAICENTQQWKSFWGYRDLLKAADFCDKLSYDKLLIV